MTPVSELATENPQVPQVQVVDGPEEMIQHPAKLLRVTSMVRGLLEELRRAPLDESARGKLRAVYQSALVELKEALSENLQRELDALSVTLEGTPSESEIRVAHAQLVGWLEGLLHGIQAALWAQQMQARAQLEELRRRALPSGMSEQAEGHDNRAATGQYL
jgi:proteasome activator-like protein